MLFNVVLPEIKFINASPGESLTVTTVPLAALRHQMLSLSAPLHFKRK